MASGVDARLLKSTKFPVEFNQKVDMQKVNLQVMKKWIASRISEILQNEDDVVIELCFNLIEGSRYPNIKALQIQLTGFLDKDTAPFCKELWKLLLSAQTSPQGIDAEKAAEDSRKRREDIDRRDREIADLKERDRRDIGARGGARQARGGGRGFDDRGRGGFPRNRSRSRETRFRDSRDPRENVPGHANVANLLQVQPRPAPAPAVVARPVAAYALKDSQCAEHRHLDVGILEKGHGLLEATRIGLEEGEGGAKDIAMLHPVVHAPGLPIVDRPFIRDEDIPRQEVDLWNGGNDMPRLHHPDPGLHQCHEAGVGAEAEVHLRTIRDKFRGVLVKDELVVTAGQMAPQTSGPVEVIVRNVDDGMRRTTRDEGGILLQYP
ncbi:PWI domain-containing protein [Paramyrothecium foliicola]|nr:PWI domain-containing protein [Paramyrothecium foliicola]